MGDCLLGSKNVYSSENLRKCYYVLDKIVDNLEGDYSITDNDLIKELELQKDELYMERIKLRDKNRELNKKLYQLSRFDNLKEIMIESLSEVEPVIFNKTIKNNFTSDIEASLILSDIHYGISVDNQLNFYNTDVAKDRLFEIVSKTIDYCKIHNVNTLHIEILGDIVSGIINTSNRVEQEEDIMTQIINVSEVLTSCISKLEENIPNVKVYTVFGNHSRVMPNKKDSINRENLERLIYQYLKIRLPNTKIVTSMNDDFLAIKIKDKEILLCHGDKDNINNAVNNYVKLLNKKFDEIHMGHFHSFEWKDDNDTDITVNGSLVGTDDYAQSIRRSTKPTQVLRVYGIDTCTYKLNTNK